TTTGTRFVSAHLLLHPHRCQLLWLVGLWVCTSTFTGGCHITALILLGAVFAVIGLLFRSSLPYMSRILDRYLPPHQHRHCLRIDVAYHGPEEIERFQLVDQQRVFLFVAGVLHRVAQFIHLSKVLFPVLVDVM